MARALQFLELNFRSDLEPSDSGNKKRNLMNSGLRKLGVREVLS